MPVEQSGDVVAEMLDDDCGLLRDGLRVELDPPHHLFGGLCLIDLVGAGGVLSDLERQLERVVAGEHVEDVALLDGLLHRVDVEWCWLLARRGAAAEQLQCLCFRGGGEREVGDVGRVGPLSRLGGQHRLDVDLTTFLFDLFDLLRGEHRFELGGDLTGLRRVRLIGDDGELFALEPLVLLDLFHGEREGLHGDDDDQLAVEQRLSQQPRLRLRVTGLRRGVAVNGGDDAGVVVDLLDRVLQLVVEDGPVGDDDDRVEHLLVADLQPRHPVRRPGDRVGLARPG